MKCKDYQKKIIKNTALDINANEDEELNLHIQHCSECQKFMERSEISEKLIGKLKQSNAEAKNPALITQNVMSAIDMLEKNRISNQTMMFFDNFLSFLESKKVKYSLAMASVILACIFVSQQYIINREVRDLKKQMIQSSMISGKSQSLKDRKLKILTRQLDMDESEQEIIELIQIKKVDFEKFLEEYNSLQTENNILRGLLNDSLIHEFDLKKSEKQIKHELNNLKDRNSENI